MYEPFYVEVHHHLQHERDRSGNSPQNNAAYTADDKLQSASCMLTGRHPSVVQADKKNTPELTPPGFIVGAPCTPPPPSARFGCCFLSCTMMCAALNGGPSAVVFACSFHLVRCGTIFNPVFTYGIFPAEFFVGRAVGLVHGGGKGVSGDFPGKVLPRAFRCGRGRPDLQVSGT